MTTRGTPITETKIIDAAILQDLVLFRCAGLDACTLRVESIDGAWPVDTSGPPGSPVELQIVVSTDGFVAGPCTNGNKGSNFTANEFREIDHGKNPWVGLRVVTPPGGASLPTGPAKILVTFSGQRIY